jgi:hypothetical protein
MMKMRSFQWVVTTVLLMAACGRIQAQPTITVPPSPQLNQSVGTDVSLNVTAHSSTTSNLQYQWLRNGVLIPSATNSSLAINDIQATNCGAFSVKVSDATGVVVSPSAEVSVNISFVAGVDDLTSAPTLSQSNNPVRSSNTNAVKQPGTPDIIQGDPGGGEIWFKWSVPAGQSSGVAIFSALGSDFDTTLGAYTGSSVANLAQELTAINDDDTAGYLNSQVIFYAESNTTYLIAVDGFYGARGDVVLGWTFSEEADPLPTNALSPQAITSSNGAFLLLNVPWTGGANCDWFLNGLIASTTGGVLVTNVTDDSVGAFVASLLNPDNITDLSEPIEVQINTLQDGSTDTNAVAWVKFRNSANNAFLQPGGGTGDAIKLGGGDTAGFSCSQVFSTVGNPDEPGEPVVGNQNGAHPCWFAYITPVAGSLLVNTAGSTFNSILGVFVGPGNSFATLTNIGFGYTTNYELDGQPSVFIPNVPAGQTNYIVVEGENGASGTVQLNLYLATTSLSIVPTRGGFSISWPSLSGTNLQVSTNMAEGWQPANLTISTADNTNSVTAIVGAGSQFFRLAEPLSLFKK